MCDLLFIKDKYAGGRQQSSKLVLKKRASVSGENNRDGFTTLELSLNPISTI